MKSADFPNLETERLLLREIVYADVPALFAIHGDPETMKWFGVDPLVDEAGAAELVDLFASYRTQPNPGARWGIQLKDQASIVGSCGLFAWHRGWNKCTLGYELHPRLQGQGYMNEALLTCIDWGFQNMALNRIEAQVHPCNAASIRTLERLGFEREGISRQLGFWRGQYHDMFQYALLRQDWPMGEA